jgi:cytochrome oxidase assembly protein ShyY1
MMKLGVEAVKPWPRVVQSIDITELAADFDLPIYPYTVRLAEHYPGSYQANWQLVNLQPSKHIGYAVQWFAMSFTLVLIALLANTNIWAWLKAKKLIRKK